MGFWWPEIQAGSCSPLGRDPRVCLSLPIHSTTGQDGTTLLFTNTTVKVHWRASQRREGRTFCSFWMVLNIWITEVKKLPIMQNILL